MVVWAVGEAGPIIRSIALTKSPPESPVSESPEAGLQSFFLVNTRRLDFLTESIRVDVDFVFYEAGVDVLNGGRVN